MAIKLPTGRERGAIDCDGRSGYSRRSVLKAGLFGFMGLSLMDLLRLDAIAGESSTSKCDSVILVWLAGGPSHIDTFDPKPGEATGGPIKPISTSANGIQICEHMPIIARNMKHAALIRSLTSKEGSHERATYEMHTGYKPLGSIKHPSLGSLVAKEKGKKNEELPAYIALGNSAMGAGFLGTQVAPFYIGDINNPTKNLDFAPGVDHPRFSRRVDLLQRLDMEFSKENRDDMVGDYGNYYRDAVRMMYSKSVEAFDLSQEKEIYRKGYGENNLGKSLLMARRLIEKGVRFVEVTQGGWDNHNEAFTAIEKNCNTLDPALGTLIEDLNARGMLDRTMVICTGEFGRTPQINARNGRDHYPRVWSGLIAGGGIKRGFVHGSTDQKGTEVKDGPVSPGDLHATMFSCMGVEYAKENQTDQGRPIRIVDKGKPVEDLIA